MKNKIFLVLCIAMLLLVPLVNAKVIYLNKHPSYGKNGWGFYETNYKGFEIMSNSPNNFNIIRNAIDVLEIYESNTPSYYWRIAYRTDLDDFCGTIVPSAMLIQFGDCGVKNRKGLVIGGYFYKKEELPIRLLGDGIGLVKCGSFNTNCVSKFIYQKTGIGKKAIQLN